MASTLILVGPDGFDDVTLRRMSGFFREVFATAFGQYLFYPSQLEPIAPEAVLGARPATLAVLDDLDREAHGSAAGEIPHFWHEPATTFDNLRRKLSGRGHAVLQHGPHGEMRAMTFAYRCSLREAFGWEEWENPVTYSGFRPEGRLRSFEQFRTAIQAAVAARPAAFAATLARPPLGGDSPVLVWNCVAVGPGYRGLGLAPMLMRRLAETLPFRDDDPTLHLAEVMPGSYAHRLMTQAGAVDVPGALGDVAAAPRLVVSPLAEHIRRLRLAATS